ncbi:3-isopropylmalate dehydratase large subunit [Pararhodobacter sp. SW119]|uniref:3-isopropylmalate dehydratase large subunit n=1 Tax=Pararhodobacter sp. SW119 TaxID=2780075 RepID=UPI001ADF888C|nr:3-isopropylmalate dehydratase large subunit [Pararhodobacter sp. SW119]
MTAPRTLFDKLWDSHVVGRRDDGSCLLWIDRHFVHEGSHHAFRKLSERGIPVSEPGLTFGVADHYVPTRGRARSGGTGTAGIENPTIRGMVTTLEENTKAHGIHLFGLGDRRQGIVHVVGPEQGLTLPGLTIVCGDSHTSTHGAFGAMAFGIGATDVAHVMATQTIWKKKLKVLRIRVDGRLGPGVGAKDVALAWIARLGADGARGHVVEYAGPVVEGLTMEGRMTLCNLSIEGGARCGMVAPDAVTLDYLHDRPFAPKGDEWEVAEAAWRALASDDGAEFDREVTLDGSDIAPVVTWGTSPEDAAPIDATVPDPDRASEERAGHIRAALDYMGLAPGRPLDGIAIDQVFIGSCTNARIEDLRAAAAVLKGRRAQVPGLVSPGSSLVKAQAEAEGLDQIFRAAGLEWVESGCSMCVGMNGDIVAPGKRCASTTNRNFRGRQGPGARTHLMSPAMVAAAAIAGHLTDVRPMLEGRT